MPPGALPRAALAAPTLLAWRRWAAKETLGCRAEIQTFLACIGIVHGNSYHLSLGGGSSAQLGRQNNNGLDRERARGATMDREHQEVAAPPWRPASLVLRRPAYPAALPHAAASRRLAWFCSVMPRAPAIIYLLSRFACCGTV